LTLLGTDLNTLAARKSDAFSRVRCYVRHRVQLFQTISNVADLVSDFLLHPSLIICLLGFWDSYATNFNLSSSNCF